MKRFTLVIFLMLFSSLTHAGPRLGEMESAGAPPPPYIPKAPVNYTCDIYVSLSDGTNYKRLKSTVEFRTEQFMTSGHASHTTGNDPWIVVSGEGKGDVSRVAHTWLKGHMLSLSFHKNQNGSEQAHVYLRSVLDNGKRTIVDSSSTANVARTEGKVEGNTSIGIRTKGKSKNLSVSATCLESK